LSLQAKLHTIPAKNPIAILAQGATYPEAGVIATRPATIPEQKLTAEYCRVLYASKNIHVSPETEAAREVTKADMALLAVADIDDPPLNPNQPNQSNPVPSSTNIILCGFVSSFECRLPVMIAYARPANPDAI
jgi:hypothetical protein